MDMIVSSVGIWLVSQASESQCFEPLAVMRRAYSVTAFLSIFGLLFTTRYILHVPSAPHAWLWFFACGIVGVATAFLLVRITQYFTDFEYAPVQSIAAASISGHATNIIAGVSTGFISTAAPSIVICAAVLASYHFGVRSGVSPTATATAGEFGVAVSCFKRRIISVLTVAVAALGACSFIAIHYFFRTSPICRLHAWGC
jgi:inorganic pyrophosphatase